MATSHFSNSAVQAVNRTLPPHKFIDSNKNGRDWICGDLHGQFEVLRQSLEQAGFDPVVDRFFLLGDVIDRGPQSRDLLRWVLEAEYVYSVMGNHELLFRGGSFSPKFRDRHVAIGGEWSEALHKVEYQELAAACASHFPLTMTLECQGGTLGLVHAQSPFDDWKHVQTATYSDRLAIDCTWPWSGMEGPEQAVTHVNAVVSGHTGTDAVVIKGNQVWIDTMESTGQPTLVTVEQVFDWVLPQ